jgi:hypothetical protein
MFPIAQELRNIEDYRVGKAAPAQASSAWARTTATTQGGRYDRLLVAAEYFARRRFS